MATETLRPNAAGDECNWELETGAACPNHYQNVDEETKDDGTTMNKTSSTNYVLDLYNIADHSAGSGIINHITVYAWSYANATPDQTSLKIAIKSGTGTGAPDTVSYGSEETMTTGWALYSKQWTTNPATGNAWTWDEIDKLQIGVAGRESVNGTTYRTYCTQVYVEIDYAAVTPKTSSDAGSGVDAYVSLEQEVAKSSSDTGSGVDAYVSLEQGVAKSSSDAGSGVEGTPMQATALADSELGQGSDSLIAKIETPTKGGGTKLWT